MKIKLGMHEQVKLYIVFWFCIVLIFILFFMVTGANKKVFTCVDGTETFDPKSCPQCVTDSDCDLDSYCRVNQCRAKECVVDADCRVAGNECIFGQCRNVGGYSTNIAPGDEEDIDLFNNDPYE